MKKIKIFPAPHVEMRVHVSDEMIKNYRECRRIAVDSGNCKDCITCKWRDSEIGDVRMCELKEMQQLLPDGERKESGTEWKAAVMRTFLGGRA